MRPKFLLLPIILIYFFVFSFLSISRHRSLHSTYLDLGLESQAIWNTSQGRYFETSFGDHGELISALSYHFTPILLLIAPVYTLLPSPETLLLIQSLVLSLGALAVYLVASKILASPLLSVTFVLVYLFYPPLEYVNLSDFHYVSLATTFLLFTFYFLIERRWFLFTLFLILSVSTKENLAVVAAIFGAYLFVVLKEKKRGVIIFIIFNFYFLIYVFYLVPLFGGNLGAVGRYTTLTANPSKALLSLLNLDKLKYLFHLLVSVGFLPLLAPGALILAGSEIFLNLFSDYNPQWQVKFHYTAAITPFVFTAAIFGVGRLKDIISSKAPNLKFPNLFISLYLLPLAIFWNVIHSPSPLFHKFDWSKYQETAETREVREILKTIPSSASVSAMNNLGPHLANRRFLYRFPIRALESDYIIVDPGVVGKDFDLSQITRSDYQSLISNIELDRRYQQVIGLPRLLIYRSIK